MDLITEDDTVVHEHRSVDGFSPLHCAVYANNIFIVLQLLGAGADPNAPSSTGITPIILALKTSDTNPLIIRKLMKQGGAACIEDIKSYHQKRIIEGDMMTFEYLTHDAFETQKIKEKDPFISQYWDIANANSALRDTINNNLDNELSVIGCAPQGGSFFS
jgi:ankyrin repeat protein